MLSIILSLSVLQNFICNNLVSPNSSFWNLDLADETERRERDQAAELAKEKALKGPTIITGGGGTDKMDMLITTVQEGNANMVRAVQGSGVG